MLKALRGIQSQTASASGGQAHREVQRMDVVCRRGGMQGREWAADTLQGVSAEGRAHAGLGPAQSAPGRLPQDLQLLLWLPATCAPSSPVNQSTQMLSLTYLVMPLKFTSLTCHGRLVECVFARPVGSFKRKTSSIGFTQFPTCGLTDAQAFAWTVSCYRRYLGSLDF